MNTANSKTKHSKKFVYNFTDKLNLKNPNKNIALANLSIYYTWKNVKSDYNNNKFKISAPTWNDTFDVPDGSYSIAALLKSGYKLELLSKETMRLLGSSTDTIDGDKNSELVPKLESVNLVLVHCNLVNNSYQHRFISKKHNVYTENINKIALSNNDDKRIVSLDKITSYPYGYKGKKCIN